MLSHRVPLASNPNAANSPRRVAPASKRGHAQLAENDDPLSPPRKRQNVGPTTASFKRAQNISVNEPEGRVFTNRRDTVTQNQFQRKLLATQQIRQNTQSKAAPRQLEHSVESQEQIQNWRKHYRRVFPAFVFYFDGLSPDVALRSRRTLAGLGARHAEFFSKDVTHVITTRPIPPELAAKDGKATIDPALLGRLADQKYGGTLPGRLQPVEEKISRAAWDSKPTQLSNDIVHRARQLNIKVWALEKFERISAAMRNVDEAEQSEKPVHIDQKPITHAKAIPLKRERDEDNLSQLLRNEKNNPTVQRKPWQEIIPFKGIYIYIHDMEEQVKPVMIREYGMPTRKEEGEWPMLRSVSKGRCPFIEEPVQERRFEQIRARKEHEVASRQPPRLTRAHTTPTPADHNRQVTRTRSQTRSPERKALNEHERAQNHGIKPSQPAQLEKCDEAPALSRQVSCSVANMPPLLGSTHANFRGIPRNPGGEPMASGLQGQNITSAIRSQMYSSTAPSAPGTRVGMSKQQHQMSRKVLERQSGLSGNSVPSSFNINEVRAAINNTDHSGPPRRSTRQRTGEPLKQINEEDDDAGGEGSASVRRGKEASRKKKVAKRDPKPGYCENCKDKYEDFYEHIVSRKHKKFAATDENWKELDELLEKLVRV